MKIAEIGNNHNGDEDRAMHLAYLSIGSGADIVKFQRRSVFENPELYERDEIRDTPKGEMSYLDYRKYVELPDTFYDELVSLNIPWTVSVWDLAGIDFIEQYDVPFVKLPSARLNRHDMLYRLAKGKHKVLISTGASTLEEISVAIDILGDKLYGIMACSSVYPAKKDYIGLNKLRLLIKLYPDKIVGFSSHDQSYSSMVIAKAMGAKIFERHVTDDQNIWGTDQPMSTEFQQFKIICSELDAFDEWFSPLDNTLIHPFEQDLRERLK